MDDRQRVYYIISFANAEVTKTCLFSSSGIVTPLDFEHIMYI